MVHRLILLGLLLMSIVACRRRDECPHPSIPIINRTPRAVYCRYAQVADTYDWVEMSKLFGNDPRDDGYQQQRDSSYYSLPNYTENRNIISASYNCIGDYFDPGDPLKGIFVFIIDSAMVDSLTWDTVKSRNIYTRLYKLNFEAMEQMNWVIDHKP